MKQNTTSTIPQQKQFSNLFEKASHHHHEEMPEINQKDRQAFVDMGWFNDQIANDPDKFVSRQIDFKDVIILQDCKNIRYTCKKTNYYDELLSKADKTDRNKQGNTQIEQRQVPSEVKQQNVAEEQDYSGSQSALANTDAANLSTSVESQGQNDIIQELNDLNLRDNVYDRDEKFDPEKYHWRVLKNWRDSNVKYQCLRDIQVYKFKAEDERGFFQKQVLACQKFFNKKITDNPNKKSPGSDINMLAHYEVNQLTGEKFLRLTIRQWKTSYDPEINQVGFKKLRNLSDNKQDQDYEIHSLKFFKFDEELQEFDEENEILYDISENFLDPFAGCFNNDFFLTKNELTYYFKKDREKHGFQLYRHSYGTPFQKFPVDNDPFPFYDNELMEGFFIEAPRDKDLNELQISFLWNASLNYSLRSHQKKEEKEFLDNQYIMVKDKIYAQQGNNQQIDQTTDVFIYKVSDGKLMYNSKIDKNLEYPLLDLQCGFFIDNDSSSQDQKTYHFLLKCKKRDYQIMIKKEGPEIETSRSSIFLRNKQHMIKLQNFNITLDRLGDRYNQQFFFTKSNSRVNFIYPLHSSQEENISSDIKNKQQEVSTHIQKYYLHNQSGKIVYQDNEFAFIDNKVFREHILSNIDPKLDFDDVDDEYISTSDMILKVNVGDNRIHVWSMTPHFEYTSFRETLTEIQDNNKKLLEQIILSQFSLDNCKVYGDNYNNQETLGIYQNQYLNRVYLTSKEGVYLQHHKAYIYNEPFKEVPDDIILLDLKDQDGQISMVKLYNTEKLFPPNKNAQRKSDLKLHSYHISYTIGVIAFFFIQRNMDKQLGLYASQINQSGVEFMVMHTIENLKQMADSFKKECMAKQCIIEHNTPVFIFGTNLQKKTPSLIYTKYDREFIMKYQDNSKAASMMASTLVHEMVHDPQGPIDWIAPFLFSSEVSRLPTPVFKWYFCFMNLMTVKEFIESDFIQKNRWQTKEFIDFCDVFLIRDFEDPMVSDRSNNDHPVRFENQRTRDCPLFCRSSNWTDLSLENHPGQRTGIDLGAYTKPSDTDEVFRTNFQLGFVQNPKDTQMFEITEYSVHISTQKIFRNTDLIDFGRKLKDGCYSHVRIEPYQLQNILPSASANEMFIGMQKFWENHRIIPIMNNKGEISGTRIMLNMYMIYKESVMITSEIDVITDEQKNLGSNYNIILSYVGQEVLLLGKEKEKTGLIYLQSGLLYEVPLTILVDEQGKSLADELVPKPLFIYQMLCNSDQVNQPLVQFRTPIFQVGYKQLALDGQPGRLITICTSRFNRDIVANRVFDRISMQHLLHQSQTEIMTSSLPSLKEIFKSKQEEKAKCYFQFRILFNGQSFCSVDFPSFKNSVKKLEYAVQKVKMDHTKITEDSALYKMLDYSTDEEEQNSREKIEEIFSLLNIEPQMKFMANWNYESFVQKSLDSNFNRPLLFIMDYLINQQNDALFKSVLIQDLPQLLSQDSVNINQFLNQFKPNQCEADDHLQSNNQDGCRLESSLNNPDLPILGEEFDSILVKDFICFFDMRQEMESHLIQEWQVKENLRHNEQQELLEKNQDIPSESRCEIQHTFINFIPLINKMKIDLLMKRQPSSLTFTQYLTKNEYAPHEIDYIDDMFLTDLFNNHIESLEFFQQESIQKIIDRQFKFTAQTIRRLLIIYTFGFVIPVCINVYITVQQVEYTDPVTKKTEKRNTMLQDLEDHVVVFVIAQSILSGATQIFFLTMEFAEIQYSGLSAYFNEGWNYMDCTQGVFYTIQLWIRLLQDHNPSDAKKFWKQIVLMIVVCQSSIKFLQLIRYKVSFCFLVEMLMQVSKDVYPFCIVLFTFCAVFVMVTLILGTSYDPIGYPFMQDYPLIIIMLQTFRNSVGDLSNPWVQDWVNDEVIELSTYQYVLMGVTWFFFIANIFIMQIVLLNFLIAEVSMTYDRINNLGPCLMFQKKQELNFFIQKVLKFYNKYDPFKALIFISPENVESDEDQFDFLKSFRNEIIHNVEEMSQTTVSKQKQILEQFVLTQLNQNQWDQRIQKIQDQVSSIQSQVSLISDNQKMIGTRSQQNSMRLPTRSLQGHQN